MKYISIAIMLASVVLAGCSIELGHSDPDEECIEFGGMWIEESHECEGISAEQCSELGGDFNECASACRNDPDAEMCTRQCVLVCAFD